MDLDYFSPRLPSPPAPIHSTDRMCAGRLPRFAIVAALALAFWTIAWPASASSAAFCDDRGASAVAPPPVLVPPEAVLVGRVGAECRGERLAVFPAVGVSHDRTVISEGGVDPALAIEQVHLCSPGHALRPGLSHDDTAGRDPRGRLERPPKRVATRAPAH
jgi:hypothetical protein